MKTRVVFISLAFLFLSGCSVHRSVNLDPQFWNEQGKRVGVALFVLPHAETTEGVTPAYVYGNISVLAQGQPLWNGDMAYEPLRLADMKPLQQAAQKEDPEVFYRIQDLFVEGFRERGFDAFKIDQPIVKKDIPNEEAEDKAGPLDGRDFRNIGKFQAADYLMVIELVSFGPYCHYIYAYNDHMSVDALVRAELIDARTNRVLWREIRSFNRPVKASCSNQDHIPIITRALRTLLSDAALLIPHYFFSSNPLEPQKPRRVILDIKALSRARS